MNPELICMHCMAQLEEPKGGCPVCGFDNASAENAPNQLECGSILAGTYLVGCVLGQGGFGITYIGLDLNLNLKVAIKEFYPEGCVTRDGRTHTSVVPLPGEKKAFFEKGREKFVSEAQILARFTDEPSIVGVRGFFHENGTAYIVMNFVEGETLKARALRNGGRLPSAEVLELIKPLCASLSRVHEAGLLHRDISPDNIIIKKNGMPVLLDFGAARQISMTGEHSNTINVKHGFAPEEQYRTRGEQGPWTDVYALCATIYRLTTGVTPPQALDRLTSGVPITPPNQLGADLTPAQEAAVMHGLAVRSQDRIASMDQLLRELSLTTVRPVKQPEKPKPAGFDHYEKTQSAAKPNARPKFLLPVLIVSGIAVLALAVIFALNALGKSNTKEVAAPAPEATATPLPLPEVGQVLEGHLAAGAHYSAVLSFDGTVSVYGGGKSAIDASYWTDIAQISGYGDLLAGLRSDGTVVVNGIDAQYLDNNMIDSWTDIVQIEVSYHGLLALTQDGYVLYTGNIDTGEQDYGRSDCVDWYSVKKLIKGDEHIVAINTDGTMDSAGMNNVNQCAVSGFSDVIDAATGCQCTYILHANGTVDVIGGNPDLDFGQKEAADWTDIIAIECGDRFVIGLKRDGTVVAAGDNEYGQKNVRTWTNIVAICAGTRNSYAMDANGLLYSTEYDSGGQKEIDGTFIH
ncbi:MAG TPA: protein kinase [Candidatus Cryosericum sp.]|nr:protein kinase [Candidatus Cryosericum sp.]